MSDVEVSDVILNFDGADFDRGSSVDAHTTQSFCCVLAFSDVSTLQTPPELAPAFPHAKPQKLTLISALDSRDGPANAPSPPEASTATFENPFGLSMQLSGTLPRLRVTTSRLPSRLRWSESDVICAGRHEQGLSSLRTICTLGSGEACWHTQARAARPVASRVHRPRHTHRVVCCAS